jgi:hypothetical protein
MAFFSSSGWKRGNRSLRSRVAVGITGAAASAATGCAGSAVPAGPAPLPETVVLRVDRVIVSPTKPETTASWDQSPAETPSALCDFVGAAVGAAAASPVAAQGAELLCQSSVAPTRGERRPDDPDLALRISAGTGASYVSRVARDALAETFKYEIAIPTGAIPADGLLLEVLDDDAAAGSELIGAIRIGRQDLARALGPASRVWVSSDRGIRRMELIVTPYQPTKLTRTSMPAREGLHQADARALYAGEVVALKASGAYTVGTWYDAPINPLGYPAAKARSYNFREEPFSSAPHACGVATVGVTGRVQGVVVTAGRTFVAEVPGPLRFGVNDIEPGNNHGSLEFEGATRAPTAEEWRRQQATGSGGTARL